MNEITLLANAKINLGLDITGKRNDGYHYVRMVMQTLNLADVLTIEKTNKDGIEIVADVSREKLSLGSDNLIYKAAELLMYKRSKLPFKIECNKYSGIRIRLSKKIPIAAGLAGGSADAAAVLRGLNELFEMGISDKNLRLAGLMLGADVPYCILGGTALSEGIGEILTPLPEISKFSPALSFVVAKPGISVSTKEAYQQYDELFNETPDKIIHPDIDGICKAFCETNINGVFSRLGNVLEMVTAKKYPIIRKIEDCMMEAGAGGALMSGSGPTVFGIFTDQNKAWDAAEVLANEKAAEEIYVVKSVGVKS